MAKGILNINKPSGFTSFDVVAIVRKAFGERKAGHAGTLDPDAQGVLVVCLGNATKIVEFLSNDTKTYEAELLLGTETDTGDISGNVLERRDVNVKEEDIFEAVRSFTGEIYQVPPMYSALKVNGRKLYELARQGIEVERKARKVNINSIEITGIEIPVIKLRVDCSKGTYIRTLCQDIGRKLGTCGTMRSLVRTRSGRFKIEDALDLETVRSEPSEDMLTGVDEYFSDLSGIVLPEDKDKAALNGNRITGGPVTETEKVRIYTSGGRFVGIYKNTKGILEPVRMFL